MTYKRYPLDAACPKCPGEYAYAIYEPSYDRSVDQTHRDQIDKRIDDANKARQGHIDKWRAENTIYENSSWWYRLWHQRPDYPHRIANYSACQVYDIWNPSYRWDYDPEWDVEHLLMECASCGYTWREHLPKGTGQ